MYVPSMVFLIFIKHLVIGAFHSLLVKIMFLGFLLLWYSNLLKPASSLIFKEAIFLFQYSSLYHFILQQEVFFINSQYIYQKAR